MPEQAPKSQSQRIRELVESHAPYWDKRHVAMQEERAFLEGDRYQSNTGDHNRDRRLIQIRGNELLDTIRHIAAVATQKPRSIEPRPIDLIDDPDMGEIAASLVEMELSNPWKGFEDRFEEAVVSCREVGLGIVLMEWDPQCNEYGEILFNSPRPEDVTWDEAYDPHHPRCSYMLQRLRLDVDEIRYRYGTAKDNLSWIVPDGYPQKGIIGRQERAPGVPLVRGSYGDALSAQKDNKATLWLCWYKNDRTAKYRDRPGDEPVPLEEGDRYLSCMDGCGYRSPTQGALESQGKIENELPPMLEGGCPECGGNLDRIDAKYPQESVRAYEKGKRLVIIAPGSPAPDDQPIYDGKWPIPQARSFPGLFLTAYIKPGKPVGPSDTWLMWDQQKALDELDTSAVQQVMEHRGLWVFPGVGIEDADGNRFEKRDDQLDHAFRDMTQTSWGPLTIEHINATGVDPNYALVRDNINARLVQYRPVADFGLTPESSKDIAVGTVERITQQAEIATAHFKRRMQRQMSMFSGVLWDYIRATTTPQKLQRLRIEGIDINTRLSGDDLPNYDFVLEDTPDFTGIDKARAQAWGGLLQTIQQAAAMGLDPMEAIEVYAEINQLPRSVVRKVEKMLQAARAAAPTIPGMPPTGGATPEAPPMDESMNGEQNGAGMELAPVT